MTPEQIKEVLFKHRLWLATDGNEGKRANLQGANLPGANLVGADLRNANLEGANLEGAILEVANLVGANLVRANLVEAYLLGANLQGTNLRGVNLYGAALRWTNLQGANLVGADLTEANLRGTAGNMKQIKSIQLDTYPITYTADRLQIACENHSIEAWKGFSKEDIEAMLSGALEWWKKYCDHIFKTIELSPATPTGHEGKE